MNLWIIVCAGGLLSSILYKLNVPIPPINAMDAVDVYKEQISHALENYMRMYHGRGIKSKIVLKFLEYLSSQVPHYTLCNLSFEEQFQIDMPKYQYMDYFEFEQGSALKEYDYQESAKIVEEALRNHNIKISFYNDPDEAIRVQKDKTVAQLKKIRYDLFQQRENIIRQREFVKNVLTSQYTWYVVGGIGVAVTGVILFKYTQTLPPLNFK